MEPTTIMIAEDNAFYRHGLESLLNDLEGVKITGTAENGAELLSLVKKNQPDLVFTDIQMPVMDGVELTKILQQQYPDIHILALMQYLQTDLITDMIMAGAKGYLEKSSSIEELAHAINVVRKGLPYHCPRTAVKLISILTRQQKEGGAFGVKRLFTEVEREIIRLICEGYATKQIAPLVHLSEKAVEKHRTRIMQKTGVRSVSGLVAFAARHQVF